jgi:DNA modification methylase
MELTSKHVTLFNDDCRERLKKLPDDSVDAIVTDPPYELAMFGLDWDDSGVAVDSDMWRECWRVLKPGGHLIAFTAARIYHRVATAIDVAGFEIRDQLLWIYTSGFPKSMDVSAAIDKMKSTREQVLKITHYIRAERDRAGSSNIEIDDHFGFKGMAGHWTTQKSQPQCPTRDQWDELVTFLDMDVPEDIAELVDEIIADKGQPGQAWLDREVTGHHDKAVGIGSHGGPNRLGEKREIPTTELAAEYTGWGTSLKPAHEPCVFARKPLIGTVAQNVKEHRTGGINIDGCRINGERFPTNLMGDEDALTSLSSAKFGGLDGAAKVFFCPKPNSAERGDNLHPTLKPIDLMRYLCRLITPNNGVVLDPFMGSGTTGIAARLEGFQFIGIEQSEHFFEYAQKRLDKHIVGQAQSMTSWFN